MVAMGAPSEVIEQARGSAQQSRDLEIFEDNVPAVAVFQRMHTQWRTRGMDGAIMGMDYAPLPFVMRMCGIAANQRQAVFEDIVIMEIETLKVIREKQE